MSSLGDRLAALRGSPATASRPADELLERLQKLGVRGRVRGRERALDNGELAALLQARPLAGGVLQIERRMQLPGDWDSPAELPGQTALAHANLLFFDTETTGLSGGSGTLAFMVGCARIARSELTVRQYMLTRFGGEQTLLESLAAEVKKGDRLVSYNGSTFDLPLLDTRFRLQGLANPLASLPHLDLLHWVRRAYGSLWEDCRLGRVETRLLDFERRDDLPGSAAPAAWFDWVRHRQGGRLPGVARHNRWDLRSLALLLPRLAAIVRDPHAHRADTLALARHCHACGDSGRALRMLERGQQRLGPTGQLELARLLRRAGRVGEARQIWARLAAQGNDSAREQLAKYYEHGLRDYRAALSVAQNLAGGEESRQRCTRLRRKIARAGIQLPLLSG